ncbi:MAG TPA: Rv3235 family protein [Pseudonocardiaceae bacterium]|nr:Rv3235 family protein [Pseudonocardiaceae bacterium]
MTTTTAAVLPTIRPLADHRRRPHLVPVRPPAARVAPPPPPPPGPAVATLRRLLTGMLEVMEGRRSPGQLAGVLPCRYQRTLLKSALAAGPGARRLRSLHVSRTAPDVVDICARVEHQGRSRALTGRLAHQANRWHFTQLELV